MRLKDRQGSGVDENLPRSSEIWRTEFAARFGRFAKGKEIYEIRARR
jgi:hypothetical protein